MQNYYLRVVFFCQTIQLQFAFMPVQAHIPYIASMFPCSYGSARPFYKIPVLVPEYRHGRGIKVFLTLPH